MEGREHTGVTLAMNASGDMKRKPEWDRWYVEDRWPELSIPDAFHASALFSIADGHTLPTGVSHLAILASSATPERAALDALERELTAPVAGTSRPPSSRAHVTSYTKFAEWGDGAGRRANGVVLIFIDALHAEQEDAFNEWYSHHAPDMLEHLDFFACTRYVADVRAPWQPTYISIYETESDDVGRICREGYDWYFSTIPSIEDYVPQARMWWEQPFERRA